MSRTAWGRGLTTLDADGVVLDAWFPQVGLGEMPEPTIDARQAGVQRHDDVRGVDVRAEQT